jgi:MFS family permease
MSVLTREPRALAFGLLHTVAATIGQTFVISLFLPGIKEAYELSAAQVALLYTTTTLASAAALWKVGPWIDRADTVRYALWSALLLALACGVMATAHHLVVLIVGLFFLRLAGNGLLPHVALTATARYFVRHRGQALSLVLLGSSIGEGGFPAPLVATIATLGWRPTLALTGIVGALLVAAGAAAVRKEAAFRAKPAAAAEAGRSAPSMRDATHAIPQRRFFLLTAPLFIGMPLVVTATIFHQALVAEARGLSLKWFAVAFIAFALSRVVVSVVTGPIVDRFGSTWLFCLHLLPLAAGTAALVLIDSTWIAPMYWFCAGVSSGLGTVLHMTVVAERVVSARLGTARSIVAAAGIVASAVGPSLYGAGLALGASIPALLWASVTLLLGATVIGLVVVAGATQATVRDAR